MALDNQTSEAGNDFTTNLQFLCSTKKSVSQICRELGINRPQFGRYLHGKARPNAHNLMIICEYFGVSSLDLERPHQDFKNVLDLSKSAASTGINTLFSFAENFGAPPAAIKRYAGDYLIYHTSRTLRNATFVSLCRLEMRGTEMHSKTIYRGNHPVLGGPFILKMAGQVFLDRGQLYIVKGYLPSKLPLSFDTLDVSSFGIVKYLTGTLLGKQVGGHDMRIKKTVWRHLGKNSDLRRSLAECGVFRKNSTRVDPNVRNILADDV